MENWYFSWLFNTFAMSAKGYVGDTLVAEAELSAAIVDTLPA